jgi:hypothetical protein
VLAHRTSLDQASAEANRLDGDPGNPNGREQVRAAAPHADIADRRVATTPCGTCVEHHRQFHDVKDTGEPDHGVSGRQLW